MTEKMESALYHVFEAIVEENPNAVHATIKFTTGGECTVEVETRDFAQMLQIQRL